MLNFSPSDMYVTRIKGCMYYTKGGHKRKRKVAYKRWMNYFWISMHALMMGTSYGYSVGEGPSITWDGV